MIENLKTKLPLIFFKHISKNKQWEYKYNYVLKSDDLLNYYIEINPENKQEAIETFTKKLEILKWIWVLKSYILTEKDNWNFIKDKPSIINFKEISKSILWNYDLEYDYDKLNLLRKILHNNSDIKYNLWLWAIKGISKVFSNYINKNSIDIEVFIDKLYIDNPRYIFFYPEVLIYSLATYKNKYLARLVSWLLDKINEDEKNTLITYIKDDYYIHYFSENRIKEIIKETEKMNKYTINSRIQEMEDNWDYSISPVLRDKNEGNIYYSEKIQWNNLIDLGNFVTYNLNTYIFTNLKNNNTYKIPPTYRKLLELLFLNRWEVIYYSYINNEIYEDDISNGQLKWNLLKCLKNNKILEKNETFIECKDWGYIVELFPPNMNY